MNHLNDIEKDVAKEVINIGLAKSADSLSFFTKQKVLIKSINLEVKSLSELDVSEFKKRESMNVLTTVINGDMGGFCYLIFSDKDVNNLMENCLPPQILADAEKRQAMTEGMLLEIDNILSASVITQFSNLLNLSMYGGVPKLDVISGEELEPKLKEDSIGHECYLSFNACFEPESLNVNPEFIWTLSDEFIKGVKGIINDSSFVIE